MSVIRKTNTEEKKPITHKEVVELVAANLKVDPKAVNFISPHENSRFVFRNGKSVSFAKCVFNTTDETQIAELRAAVKTSGTIREHIPEEVKKEETKQEEVKPTAGNTAPGLNTK